MAAAIFIMKLMFVIIGMLLTLLILARKSEGGGLTSAFGGVGGGEALGVKAAQHLDRVITILACIMLAIAVWLNILKPSGPLSQYKKADLSKSASTPSEGGNPSEEK